MGDVDAPTWNYRKLPSDYGHRQLSAQEKRDSSKELGKVLRYPDRWSQLPPPHPHELPLEELLDRAYKRHVPNLSKKTVHEVFENNPYFEVRREVNPDTGAVSELVRVVGGPDSCEDCLAAGTTHTQLGNARHAVKCARRQQFQNYQQGTNHMAERMRPLPLWQSYQTQFPAPVASPWPHPPAADSWGSGSWGRGWWHASSSSTEPWQAEPLPTDEDPWV